MEVINEIGLYPLIREFANVDPELYGQVKRVFLFNFPLIDALLVNTKDDRCFVYGCNHQEALGFKVTKKANKVMTKIVRPRELEVLKHKDIATIVYNRHVMVLTTDGQLYGWGRNENAPLGKHGNAKSICVSPTMLMDNVKKVDTQQHTIIVDHDGKVFCFGLNRQGQVNPESPLPVQRLPLEMSKIKERAIDVACSSNISAVLTENNKLYMWGTTQNRLVNIYQSMNQLGKLIKLITVEHKYSSKMNDTWLITLNREHQVHVHRFTRKTGRLCSCKLRISPIIIDIIGSNCSNFALITNDGRCLLFKHKAGEPSTHYAIIANRTQSYMDAAKLNSMALKSNRMYYLTDAAKNMATIQALGSFDMANGTDFTICWEEHVWPKIRVQSSVLFGYNPYLKANCKGQKLCWSLSSFRRTLRSKKSFQCGNNRSYPSYSTMYAYLMYVYLKCLPKIDLDMQELYALAEYFADEKLKTFMEESLLIAESKTAPTTKRLSVKWSDDDVASSSSSSASSLLNNQANGALFPPYSSSTASTWTVKVKEEFDSTTTISTPLISPATASCANPSKSSDQTLIKVKQEIDVQQNSQLKRKRSSSIKQEIDQNHTNKIMKNTAKQTLRLKAGPNANNGNDDNTEMKMYISQDSLKKLADSLRKNCLIRTVTRDISKGAINKLQLINSANLAEASLMLLKYDKQGGVESSFQWKPEVAPATTTKIMNTKIMNTKSMNAKIINTKSMDAKSMNTKSMDAKSINTKSMNAKSINTKSINTKSINTKSINTKSINTKSMNPKSTNAKSTNAKSTNAKSMNTKSMNTKSVNTKSVNTKSTKMKSKKASKAKTASTSSSVAVRNGPIKTVAASSTTVHNQQHQPPNRNHPHTKHHVNSSRKGGNNFDKVKPPQAHQGV